jgi:hypothetical protein
MYWIWEKPDQPIHQRLRVETFFFTLAKTPNRKGLVPKKSAVLIFNNPHETKISAK